MKTIIIITVVAVVLLGIFYFLEAKKNKEREQMIQTAPEEQGSSWVDSVSAILGGFGGLYKTVKDKNESKNKNTPPLVAWGEENFR